MTDNSRKNTLSADITESIKEILLKAETIFWGEPPLTGNSYVVLDDWKAHNAENGDYDALMPNTALSEYYGFPVFSRYNKGADRTERWGYNCTNPGCAKYFEDSPVIRAIDGNSVPEIRGLLNYFCRGCNHRLKLEESKIKLPQPQ